MENDRASQVSEEGTKRGRGKNKRFWSVEEDDVLIKCLVELASDPKWKSDSGFKSGYMNRLEEMIRVVLPTSGLRADPHIDSRLKHWSEKYSALAEMLSSSGFGWDADKKMLQVEKKVYDDWVKNHKKAAGLYGVPFPHYDALTEVYAKDKVTDDVSESFIGSINNFDAAISNEPLMIESEEEDDAESITHSKKRPIKKELNDPILSKKTKLKDLKAKGKGQSKLNDVDGLVSSIQSVSTDFAKIFENINANLGTMACAWSKAEEREQKLDDKANKVLEEVMKLDALSPSEALEVATILMAEEHKRHVFYQAPTNLRRQYVIDLLKKKSEASRRLFITSS